MYTHKWMVTEICKPKDTQRLVDMHRLNTQRYTHNTHRERTH